MQPDSVVSKPAGTTKKGPTKKEKTGQQELVLALKKQEKAVKAEKVKKDVTKKPTANVEKNTDSEVKKPKVVKKTLKKAETTTLPPSPSLSGGNNASQLPLKKRFKDYVASLTESVLPESASQLLGLGSNKSKAVISKKKKEQGESPPKKVAATKKKATSTAANKTTGTKVAASDLQSAPVAKQAKQAKPFSPEVSDVVMLQCLDGGAWYRGKVVRKEGSQVCIKYKGWDEYQWLFLPSERLKPNMTKKESLGGKRSMWNYIASGAWDYHPVVVD